MPTYNEILQNLENQRLEKEKLAKDNIRQIYFKLKGLNVEEVEISFNGSGDEGSIDDITLTPFEGGSYWNASSLPIYQELEEWAYDLLESTGVDWYNNEGGFGQINIDVNNQKYSYEVNQRYESSDLVASGDEDIL